MSDAYTTVAKCRACGSSDLTEILDLGEHALTGVFPRTMDEAIPVGPLRLVKCHSETGCGLVQLGEHFRPDLMYGDNYGYRSGLNSSMVGHLRAEAARLVSIADLTPGAVVVDIGSNDGTTLGAFPPALRRIGIDPTAAKFREHYAPGIEVIADFFSAATYRDAVGTAQASLVVSFAMFYDLEHPLDFMAEVASILAPDGIWALEQSYLPTMIEANAYDTVCHEHAEYYALSQIKWMADRVGLTLIDVGFNDVNGGSVSVVAARSDSGRPEAAIVAETIARERAMGLDGVELFRGFADRVAQSREELRGFVARARDSGSSVGALGASTKGNVLLQYCGFTADDIQAIGEVNDDKLGALTPGTLIPIVAEDRLIAEELDYLIVLPWHFRSTFLNKPLRGPTQLVFPLPELEVRPSLA